MIAYPQFRYLYPPRPEIAIDRETVHIYRGWWAQVKKQGTCNLLGISPERRVVAMNRHRQLHKAWQPSRITEAAFATLPGSGWYVFETELLHSKVAGLRDINYVHDILVRNGEYLVGTTFAERQAMLEDLFPDTIPAVSGSHRVIDEHTWLAINHRTQHMAVFDRLTNADDEGLVFKDPAARLVFCSSPSANAHWQRKWRRPSKVYSS